MTSIQITIVGITIAILISSIITLILIQEESKTFSKIITVGPIWESDVWTCTSDQDFLVYGALRGLENTQTAISIPDLGTQSFYSLENRKMETFTIGGQAGQIMKITRTGIVTGWLTLQTMSDADASCTQTPIQ